MATPSSNKKEALEQIKRLLNSLPSTDITIRSFASRLWFGDQVRYRKDSDYFIIKRVEKESPDWNCKCSKCKQDAYDNGMSFECSKGCEQATGVFLTKEN